MVDYEIMDLPFFLPWIGLKFAALFTYMHKILRWIYFMGVCGLCFSVKLNSILRARSYNDGCL